MSVEFLDDDPYPREKTAQTPTGRPARLADLVLSVAGAAMLIVASFRRVYSVSGDDEGFNYYATAWGQIAAVGSDLIGHGPRVGILLWAIAGLAMLALVVRRRGRTAGRLNSVLGGVVVGAAVTTLGYLAVGIEAAKENFDIQNGRRDVGDGTSTPLSLDFTIGATVWLSAAAVACIVLALAVPTITRWTSRDERAHQATPEFVALDDTDERLD